MRCDKCQGLVISEYGEARCLNCGRRPCDALRAMEPVAEAETIRKAVMEGATMPRFTSEEGKQRWLDAMAKRRGLKRGEKASGGGKAVPAVPAVLEPKALAIPSLVPSSSHILSVLDTAIAHAQDDVAALERARAIVARQQA